MQDKLSQLDPLERKRFLELVAESRRRQKSAIATYSPQEQQLAFHRSKVTYRLLAGGWRSGKSTAGYYEDAVAALGCDPYGKYPKPTEDYRFRIWIVVYNEEQIGRTAYRSLFEPGLFSIIRDLKTGFWRTFDPVADAARADQKTSAPALIPEDMIEGWAWKNRASRVFTVCRLKNGTEIYAFTSGSEPPTGDPVDLVHIDEDIKREGYLPELQSRLSDRAGKFIWTCRPRMKNDALVDMHKRAEEEATLPDSEREVEEFRLTFSGNPYIAEKEKYKRRRDWRSEEQRRNFDLGEFVFDSTLMYPEFAVETHNVPAVATVAGKLDMALDRQQVPENWTRYVSIDPGYGVFAALFVAVPPPEFGDYVVAYDELYLRNCTVPTFAAALEKKCRGQRFRAFVIDDHGSRIHTVQNRITIREQLSSELKRLNISSEKTGHGFILGSDDIDGRCGLVRQWLLIRDTGTPKFRILKHKVPSLVREFHGYFRKVVDDVVTDRPRNRNDHQMNNLEYLAAYNPHYYRPKAQVVPESPLLTRWNEIQKRKRRQPSLPGAGQGTYLGPGTPPSPSYAYN